MVVDLIKKRYIESTFYENNNAASSAVSITTIHPIEGGENYIITDQVTRPGCRDHNNVRAVAKKNGLQLLQLHNYQYAIMQFCSYNSTIYSYTSLNSPLM